MVERWRGQPCPDSERRQHEIFEAANHFGLCPLAAVEDFVGRRPTLDVRDPNSVSLLAEFVRSTWAIVVCFPREFGLLARARGLDSPHGQLGSTLHAVCIVGASTRRFSVLDPWCYGTDQPISVTFEQFAAIWMGDVLLADASPSP